MNGKRNKNNFIGLNFSNSSVCCGYEIKDDQNRSIARLKYLTCCCGFPHGSGFEASVF